MSDQTLREALENRLGSLPVMLHENRYPVEALPKAELLDLLAAHPAAPAVPQPVDREALERIVLDEFAGQGGLGERVLAEGAARIADAVLALLAGEQEQVESPE